MYISTKRVIVSIITMLLLLVFVAGCGNGDKVAKKPVEQEKPKAEQVAVKTDTPKSKNMVLNIDDSISEDEQFKMLSDVIEGQMKPTLCLEQDDAELQKAMETALNFALNNSNVDYRTYSEETDIKYLCKNLAISAERKNRTQEYIKRIQKNKYVANLTGVSWGNIALNSEKNKLFAYFYPEIKVASATPEYFKTSCVVKDKVYSTVGYLSMIKENDEWKIRSNDMIQIEEVAKGEAEKQ